MKTYKLFFIQILIALYLFILLGLIFHTSSHPQIFGKYTFKYFAVLVLLIVLFPLFIKGIFSLFQSSDITIFQRKLHLSPFRKIVIFTVFLFILLFPIELYLRTKYYNYETNTYRYRIDNFHPFLGQQLTSESNLHINSYGFRSNEIKKMKPKNTYRIFVLGGSTVLNEGAPFERNAVRLLERRFQEKYHDRTIEVINAGVSGYTSQHSLIQYLFYIKDFKPDMIIMWHGINDLVYSCTPSDFSYGSFRADYGHYFSVLSDMVFSHFSPQPVIQIKLVSLDFLLKALKDNLYSDLIGVLTRYAESNYTSNPSQEFSMEAFPSIDMYGRNLQTLINVTKADKVELILADQPYLYKEKMSPKEQSMLIFAKGGCTDKSGRYPSNKTMLHGMKLINAKTKDIADKNAIPFISLESQIPKNLEYFTDDMHFTEKGNQRIADVLFQFLYKNNKVSIK